MSKKEILRKQNQRNILGKKSKEKLLIALLAGGLATCTISAEAVSAASVDSVTSISSENTSSPIINRNNYEFNKDAAKDIVLNNVDLKGLDVTEAYISDHKIDINKLAVTNNCITISKEALSELNLNNGVHYLTFHFSNDVVISKHIVIIVTDNSENEEDAVTPAPDEGENNTPGVTLPKDDEKNDEKDDNVEEPGKPSEPNQPTEPSEPNEPAKPDDSSKEDTPDKDNESTIVPVINRNNYEFNKDAARDIVLNNVDLKGLNITEASISGHQIDINKLEITNNSITISKNALSELNLNNGVHYLTFHFSNGVVVSKHIAIIVTDSASNNVTPPVENTDENLIPTIEKQTITFNRDRDENIIIQNVDFKGLTLTDFYIYGKRINVNRLTVTENSIIIPKEVIFGLNLKNTTYYASAIFSNGRHVSGAVAIKITNDAALYPDNNVNTQHPTMITQGFEYDKNNPKGIEITYVNFNGNTLKTITIGNKILNSNNFETTSNSIIISAETLKLLWLDTGVHQMIFTFSNGVALSGYSDLTVVESTNIITKPSTDIIIDEDKNGEIEIPDLIPEGSIIDSITINNKVLDVIYRDSMAYLRSGIALASSNGNPVVYVENNKLYIPTETLAYIGTSSSNYDISIRLEDGSSVTQQIILKSAFDEDTDTIVPDNNTDDTITPDSSTNDNIVKDTTVDTNTSTTTDPNKSNVPKTGAAANTGLLASLFASLAAFGFTRKKNR